MHPKSSVTVVTYRWAAPADATAVTALLARSYPVLMRDAYAPEILAAALPLMTRANPALLASGRYLLAETADGTLVGSGGWSDEEPGTKRREPGLGNIRHVAVDPAAARCGIGRAIIVRCAQAALAHGITRFECLSSLNAEGFYAALGFRRLRAVDALLAGTVRIPSILMIAGASALTPARPKR